MLFVRHMLNPASYSPSFKIAAHKTKQTNRSKDNVRAVLFPTGYIITPSPHVRLLARASTSTAAAAVQETSILCFMFVTLSFLTLSLPLLPPFLPFISLQQPQARGPISDTGAYCFVTYIAQMDREAVLSALSLSHSPLSVSLSLCPSLPPSFPLSLAFFFFSNPTTSAHILLVRLVSIALHPHHTPSTLFD